MFAEFVAQTCQLALLQPPLDFAANLPPTYRQRDIRFTSLDEARRRGGPAFFKPADDKCFPAGVYASGAELPGKDFLPDETPVLIADAVDWQAEYRCFVHDRTIAALSIYLRDGELARSSDGSWENDPVEAKEAREFTEKVLAEPTIDLPPALVIDVGKIRVRGWAVIEANPAWGAGIYGCDPARVLPVLARACISRAALSAEDARWTNGSQHG
jgi:hypothetical protein